MIELKDIALKLSQMSVQGSWELSAISLLYTRISTTQCHFDTSTKVKSMLNSKMRTNKERYTNSKAQNVGQ